MKWLKALLRKFNPPKPFSPDSKWPDVLDPWNYQNKLMRDAEPVNMANHVKMLEKLEIGHKIANKGEVKGPYTTFVAYTLDNGEVYKFMYRSSLHWVEPLFPS